MKKFSRLVVTHSPQSSRADEYDEEISDKLRQIVDTHSAELVEISLKDTAYFESVKIVSDNLRDGDVVFGAGGDGINQVTLQGAIESGRDVTVGFLPLGNANDFATALNGRVKNPAKILASPTIDFHPLELLVNNQTRFYVAAYATFGVTAVAVDWLNSKETRDNRKRLSRLSPVAALKPRQLGQVSHDINAMKFPLFKRDGMICRDDSIGFLLTPAAKNMLRPSGGVTNFLARDDFFFHYNNVRDKSPGKGWIGKSLTAGRWATFGLPGVVSDYEQLEFLHPSDMVVHIGGDTIRLDRVRTINVERTQRTVKIFAPRKSLQV
ncbi:MAG: acylglycerol kinase family protein [Candidatus Nomurabacteria bacterium]|jgi:hypothetical protein|nr:acylglycerol kinase family protein [Candidatus Nomurabacteria bacterium]